MGPPPRQGVAGGPHGVREGEKPNRGGHLGGVAVARYSSRQTKPGVGGLWNQSSEAFLKQREAWELPRTCKKCKSEKAANEFHSKKNPSVYSTWCRQCRNERWEFLRAQRTSQKPPAPKFADVLRKSWAMGMAQAAQKWEDYESLKFELSKLQEEYVWMAVKKR